MKNEFALNQEQLLQVSAAMKQRVQEGMRENKKEIKALPTYVHVGSTLPNGQALVMDLGGTNIRAALVEIQDGNLQFLKGPVQQKIPLERGIPLAKEKYLSLHYELLASLDPPDNLPLGFCFSYPAESMTDGDATLIRWTKEVFVPETEGHLVGKTLLDYIAAQDRPIICSQVAIINDTVACMLAGLTEQKADAYLGLIVGTGHNIAILVEPPQIPKLPSELNWNTALPVNLESGNFTPPHLNHFDQALDDKSDDPGTQRMEKATSGVYLGFLLKAVYSELFKGQQLDAKSLVDMVQSEEPHEAKETSHAILDRSAKLVAAALSGLIQFANEQKECKSVQISAEGGLFWGAPGYAELTQKTIEALLPELGLPKMQIHISTVDNANLLGSAVAALNL